jgi:hypothetical protein
MNRTLAELDEQYRAALAWLGSLGVRTDGRLGAYSESHGDILAMVSALDGPERLERTDEIWEALYARKEASDLIRVHRSYGERASRRLRARLRDSNSGPPAGSPEPSFAAQPRDGFAELCWGAMLELNDFHTCVDVDTDVLQEESLAGASVTCAWEVKRPRTMSSIPAAIEKGMAQVTEACSGRINPGHRRADFGAVVVVLDHVLGPGAPFLVDVSRAEALANARRAIESFAAQLRPDLPGATQHVHAIGLWWRPLAVVDGVPTEFHQRWLVWLRPPDPDDWRDRFLLAWWERAEAR